MPNRALLQLAVDLIEAGLPAKIDEYDTIWIKQGAISAWISQRPHYCDRGRWLVHAESTDPAILTIDAADGFPRYYFYNESLVREFGHWFALRIGNAEVRQNLQRTLQELGCFQESN